MPNQNYALEQISKAILSGNGAASVEATSSALESGICIDDIITKGILKAWADFCVWYERDPLESLKAWGDCFSATQRTLRHIEAKMPVLENPPFSVVVAIVRGEGHILMKDILVTMLKSKGLKVYSYRKGVLMEDISEPISDPSLRFVVLSCIDTSIKERTAELVKNMKRTRPDIVTVAGGPIAESAGVDVVVQDPSKLYEVISRGE